MRSAYSRLLVLPLGLVFCASLAHGQEEPRACAEVEKSRQNREPVSLSENYSCKLVNDIKERKSKPSPSDPMRAYTAGPQAGIILEDDSVSIFVLLLAETSFPAYILQIEDARVDKQVGGSDANAGSTSLVTKGSVPAILGFAVENGALTRTESGTTITFRGRPLGIIESLRKEGFVRSFDDDLRETRFLRKFSFAVSFDTSRGNMAGTFTGDRQQLSSYSFRYDILNRRDPRHSSYKQDWDLFLQTAQRTFALQWSNTADTLLERSASAPAKWKDPALQAWFEETQRELATSSADAVEPTLRRQLKRLPTAQIAVTTRAELEKFNKAFSDLIRSRGDILEKVSKGAIITFEYTNVRQPDSPDLSNFKVISEGAFFKGRVDLTANGSFTVHNSIPSGMNLKRVRDAQANFQLDAPVGDPQFVFSFSYKFEHMMENAFAPDGMMMLGTKGDVHIGQIKLTIPGGKGIGLKIPISLTIANRTELIKEKEVRGNIGITFDLDSIFARFKP